MKKVIKKSKILTLMLILTMTFATLTGCGNSNPAGGESSSTEATNLGSSAEETTAEVEETAEVATIEQENIEYKSVTVSLPKSEKTKSMLIEKLTNLELGRQQVFNTNFFSFDNADIQEKYDIEIRKMMADILGREYDYNKTLLYCSYEKLKIYSIDVKADGLQFNYYVEYIIDKWDSSLQYSLYSISDETRAMLLEKLTDLKLVRGEEFDIKSLTFKENEQVASNKMKSMLSYAMGSDLNESSILQCAYKKIELYKIESDDTGMKFYFKKFI